MTRKGDKRALVSVFDKRSLDTLAGTLNELGFEVLSSGGTHRYLSERSIPCTAVEDLTGFPEIMGGRVKTIHPKVFGGILGNRAVSKHMEDAKKCGIRMIDLVVVNLYPFESTVSDKDVTTEDAVEMIDIGGPSLIRAAAKNHEHVTVIVDPDDYGMVLDELRKNGEAPLEMRRELAVKAFEHTSSYDIAIGNWMKGRFIPDDPWGDSIRLRYERFFELRYGENPHQRGAFFGDPSFKGISLANSDILWGKQLSYNNIYDIDAVLDILMEFPDDPCCAIVKHNNPSGVALGRKEANDGLTDAYTRALDCDSLSAFGGIVGLNRTCDEKTAELISERFFEVVVAPDFSEGALSLLKKKKNLRIIATRKPIMEEEKTEVRYVKVRGGLLVQTMQWPEWEPESWKVVSRKTPSDREKRDMVFAGKVVKHVKSNCVVLARDLATTGIGAGQMSRVDSCFMAVKKSCGRADGSILSSDAFFPFRDGIDELAPSGVTAVAQPGGSIRDQEVIDAVDEHGMSMVFTGVRLFKH